MPPVITFPLEQLTILIVDGIVNVAGVLPIAVTTTLKVSVASEFEVNLTFEELNILASLPIIEYAESPQSGLLKVNGERA